jgi:hypothetical protein
LSSEAGRRWQTDALLSLGYAQTGLPGGAGVAVALANASRGLIEASHSVLAETKQWVLNEKRIVERAGLAHFAALLLSAHDSATLEAAITRITNGVKRIRPDDS